MPKKLWFKAKKYGWGWYPASKEGWIATILLIVIVLGLSKNIPESGPNADFFFSLAILIGLFLYLCYKTGEKPRWRWGN